MKYCLPIIKPTGKEILEMIDQNKTYDMFEVWIDYINEDFIKILNLIQDLIKDLDNKVIIVFRRQHHERIHMSLNQRKEILRLCAHTHVLVDIDIEQQQEDMMFIKHNDLQNNIIASYHNYKKTPEKDELKNIVEKMKIMHPKMMKIATMCTEEKDAVRLLELLLDVKRQNMQAIILGMGEQGKMTRIFGPLMGSAISFAPATEKEASAPGQLTKQQLQNIFDIVERN